MKRSKHRVMYVIMALVFGAFLLHYISYWGDPNSPYDLANWREPQPDVVPDGGGPIIPAPVAPGLEQR
jgi:hypothetical protein